MTQLKRTTERQHPLWQLTLMRWRIFAREPAAIFWTYGFPLALALALGIAFRNRPPEPVEVAVQASPGAEAWRDALAKSPSMHVRWLNAREAHEALRAGKVSLVVSAGAARERTNMTLPGPKAAWRGRWWTTRCSARRVARTRYQ